MRVCPAIRRPAAWRGSTGGDTVYAVILKLGANDMLRGI